VSMISGGERRRVAFMNELKANFCFLLIFVCVLHFFVVGIS